MKKYIKISFFLLIITVSLMSCKKDSDPKDYAAVINNKVWTGEFHYTFKTAQPVSVEFKTGGQLTWNELAGEFSGTWKIDNDKITINFPTSNGVTADITNDNKLTNFQPIGTGFVMDHLELNSTPDESIDNTQWKTTNLLFTFKAGDKADAALGPTGTTVYANATYTRKAKFIRFSYPQYKFFNVFISSTEMNGVNQFTGDPTIYGPYKLTKQ
jgi:hypothetical protein